MHCAVADDDPRRQQNHQLDALLRDDRRRGRTSRRSCRRSCAREPRASRVKPEMTSVSPSATRASVSDSDATAGARSSDRAQAQHDDAVRAAICGVTLQRASAVGCRHDRRLVVQRRASAGSRAVDDLALLAEQAHEPRHIGHAQPGRATAARRRALRRRRGAGQLRGQRRPVERLAPSRRSARPRRSARRSAPGGGRGPARRRDRSTTRSSRSGSRSPAAGRPCDRR